MKNFTQLMNVPVEVFNELVSKLENIVRQLEKPVLLNPMSEHWIDIPDTCKLLKISKRTLQSYRDNGILSFSRIGGKIYFKVADLEEHLKNNYVRAFSSKKNNCNE
ncbi:MAG: helix-turn-helix domain-containing protein [Bacteroidia bacterium]|nr:helix-turn-helix domain-containing protein [Bacteroidia bacterium]